MKASLTKPRVDFNQAPGSPNQYQTHLEESILTKEKGRPVKHLVQWPLCPLLASIGMLLGRSVIVVEWKGRIEAEVARKDMIPPTWLCIPSFLSKGRPTDHASLPSQRFTVILTPSDRAGHY